MKTKNQTTLASKYWLLILSMICIILMGLSLVTDKVNGPLRTVANYTIVPMQKGINHIGLWMSDLTKNFETLTEVKNENEELQKTVDELTIENNRLQQERYELERLQELYALDQNYADYKKVGAHVTANDSGNWFSSFTIDKGEQDGIKKDMNVMAGTGLVGIVTEVGPNWARVRSIIDDSSNVSALILSTSDKCIVKGDLTLMNDGKIRFEQLANNGSEIKEGEQVVASHISSKYLQGILIGYVSEITTDANNLTRSGYITPAVDFQHLQEVLVIIVVCFLLECTVFQKIAFASITPNLLIIITSAFGFMRGKKEGMFVGFLSGLLVDIFFNELIGFYALIFMVIGYVNGFFKRIFYAEDIKLPLILIAASDFIYAHIVYIFLFIVRSRFNYLYYLNHIIMPELIYTILVTLILYQLILHINQKLEAEEKRSASKFV